MRGYRCSDLVVASDEERPPVPEPSEHAFDWRYFRRGFWVRGELATVRRFLEQARDAPEPVWDIFHEDGGLGSERDTGSTGRPSQVTDPMRCGISSVAGLEHSWTGTTPLRNSARVLGRCSSNPPVGDRQGKRRSSRSEVLADLGHVPFAHERVRDRPAPAPTGCGACAQQSALKSSRKALPTLPPTVRGRLDECLSLKDAA